MADNNFFAFISRMKYINRWALMRNIYDENLSQHSYEAAVISHALAVISNTRFNTELNTERAALIGLYHDTSEIFTGDMPTPVKYHNPEIQNAFKNVEKTAKQKLLSLLPQDLRPEYKSIFFKNEKDEHLWKIVKAADKISALIKCIEEEKAGNREFEKAAAVIKREIKDMKMPEVDVFVEEFLPSYFLTLDQLD
ncbi:MAG: 5'-deoxynucleotidase [Oscillospiraceae bacterium]|jgi:5'-deoxynucleotidase|nr:5'-deoxynucleotidase [Oscillospiraceae bacterium]